MATWSSNLSSNSNYEVILTVNQTSQNIGANTSNISWSLAVKKKIGSGYWANDSNASTFSVKIDGSTVSSGQKSYNFTGSTPKSVTVASGSRTITHGADGSKSIACSASWKDNKNGLGTGSPSGTLALTTIPRATQPTVSSKTVALGSAITINLPRASSSFTHRIYYNFFSATGLTGGIANYTNATTSTTFTPPTGLASSYMKNTNSNGAVIYVETRNGSTVIGTKSIGITITVPNNSTYNPSLGAVKATEQNASVVNGLSGTWVQGHSRIKVYSPVTMRAGAYAVTARVYIGGAWRAAVLRGSNIEIREDYTPTVSGSHDITVEVTDSRNRRATSTGSITVTAYSKPKLTVSASRFADNQKYIAVTARVDSSGLGSKNLTTMQAFIRPTTSTSWGTAVKTEEKAGDLINWGTINHGQYSEGLSYEVMVRVKDKLTGWSQAIIQISTVSVLMDAYRDKGVSFGKMYEVAKGGALQVGGKSTLGETHIARIIATDWNKITDVNNVLNGGTYHINGGTTANLPQNSWGFLEVIEVTPHNTVQRYTTRNVDNPKMYYRARSDSGAWSAWRETQAVEYGSNGNGNYMKFSNGTLICWSFRTAGSPVNVATQAIFRNASTEWVYPMAFVGTPVVNVNVAGMVAESWAGMGGGATNNTKATYMVWSTWSRGTNPPTVSLLAIGRWA